MANLKYEGDTDNINESQFKFIGEVLEKRGYKDTKVVIEAVGKAGDNYMASVKRIIVRDASGKPFKMVAKIAPQQENVRILSSTQQLFMNETIMYTEVLPMYRQFQKTAEVPESDFLIFAECYGAHRDAPNEVILLEDLNESNFTMLDRFESLSDGCVKSVLKNLAILHSLSYVLKHKEPQIFEDLRHRLYDMWENLVSSEEIKQYFSHIEGHALNIISDSDQKEIVKKSIVLSQFSAAISKIKKSEVGSKHTVIQQGDSWINNIMFNIDDDRTQSIMIDYQLSKENNPVADILYTIFNCTDHKMRLKHFYDWIDYYHTELDKSLANYGFKANFVYPKDQLDVDLKRYGKLMFSLGVLLARTLTIKSEEAAKMKEARESTDKYDANDIADRLKLASDTNQLFKARVQGLIDTCLEFGLF